MSSNYGKWIGAGVGFMQFGFIGAVIGYYLGNIVGKNFGTKKKMFEMSFEISLLILATKVVRADGRVEKSELDCVKLFFIQSFGKSKSDIYFKVFNEVKHFSTSPERTQTVLAGRGVASTACWCRVDGVLVGNITLVRWSVGIANPEINFFAPQ